MQRNCLALAAQYCYPHDVAHSLTYPPSWPLSFVAAPPGAVARRLYVPWARGNEWWVERQRYSGHISGLRWTVCFECEGMFDAARSFLEKALKSRGWRWVPQEEPGGSEPRSEIRVISYYDPGFIYGVQLGQYLQPMSPEGTADLLFAKGLMLSLREADSTMQMLPAPLRSVPL